jgi:hypothetical protein
MIKMADEEGTGPREWSTLLKIIIFAAFAAVMIGIFLFIKKILFP